MENPNYGDPDKGGYPGQGYQPQEAPSPQGYPPPQQGYPPQQPPPPTTHVTVTQPSTQVVVTGGCPVCHTGAMVDRFTTCGILLAIFCFPLGLICCCLMRERVCSNCGAHFGG